MLGGLFLRRFLPRLRRRPRRRLRVALGDELGELLSDVVWDPARLRLGTHSRQSTLGPVLVLGSALAPELLLGPGVRESGIYPTGVGWLLGADTGPTWVGLILCMHELEDGG